MKHFLNVWLTLLFTTYMLALTVFIIVVGIYAFAIGLGAEMTDTTFTEIYSVPVIILCIGAIICWFFTRNIDQPGWLKIIAIASFPYSGFVLQHALRFITDLFQYNNYLITFALFLLGLIKFIIERVLERKRGTQAIARIPLRQ